MQIRRAEYVDRAAVAEEVAASRRLFAEHGWPTIDVTRRSIEETAAAVLDLYRAHRLKFIATAESHAEGRSSHRERPTPAAPGLARG